MKYFYKSIKYTMDKWLVIKHLADLLSDERGTGVGLADASVEASKKMIEEHEEAKRRVEVLAGTPGGQAQD